MDDQPSSCGERNEIQRRLTGQKGFFRRFLVIHFFSFSIFVYALINLFFFQIIIIFNHYLEVTNLQMFTKSISIVLI